MFRYSAFSSEEMPFIQEKFPTYESYAKAGLNEIFSEDQLTAGTHQKLSTMSSLLIVNNGGTYEVKELPASCQLGPIKAFSTTDWNADGHMDFIYAGNHLPTEVETARYDALHPGVCFGNGKGDFHCQTFFVDGKLRTDDIRDIAVIKKGTEEIILMSNNNGPLRSYRK